MAGCVSFMMLLLLYNTIYKKYIRNITRSLFVKLLFVPGLLPVRQTFLHIIYLGQGIGDALLGSKFL